MRKCNYCGKETTNNKYCSLSCNGHTAGKIGGRIGGKIAQITLKQRCLAFYNPVTRHIGQVAARKVCKKNKLGFYNQDVQNRCKATNKQNKTGFYNPETARKGGFAAQKTLKEKKIGIYGLTLQEQINNGLKAAEVLRKQSKYLWNKVHFLSKQEMECAKKILTTPIVGVNCHIKVGTKIIDFYPQANDKMFKGKFVEYHPCNNWLHPESKEEYYHQRKKILNTSNFKNTKLIVITNLSELYKFKSR